jgi:hypothetical protein
MKLTLIFIVMDLLTFSAYPIVFLHGKLRQISKSKENIAMSNLLVAVPVTSDRLSIRKL